MFEFNAEPPFNSSKIRNAVNWFFSEINFNPSGMSVEMIGATQDTFAHYGDEKNLVYGMATRIRNVNHKYRIYLKKSLLAANQIALISILFEELYHVVQYEKGDLHDCKNKSTKFKGKYYKEEHPYEECPWEIEAKGEARRLAQEYFRYLKKEYGNANL